MFLTESSKKVIKCALFCSFWQFCLNPLSGRPLLPNLSRKVIKCVTLCPIMVKNAQVPYLRALNFPFLPKVLKPSFYSSGHLCSFCQNPLAGRPLLPFLLEMTVSAPFLSEMTVLPPFLQKWGSGAFLQGIVAFPRNSWKKPIKPGF